MRAKRSIKDSLKEYLNWCVSRLLLGGSRNDTVRDMVDAISDEIASGGGVVSQDQLDQTVQDITKSYGIADQTVLTSAEQYTDQKIADVVDGSPEALDTLYELAKALGDDSNFATTVMDLIGQKLPTTTFENFIDNKAWTKDNLTKLSQLINNINSIKAGTRVESMDVNLASMSSYLRYDLFDANTTGTKPGNLTTGFLLTFSWDNGGWGAQIAISNGNIDGAIFLRTIKDSESDKIWGPWVKVWNSNNFNPDNKFGLNATQLSDLNNAPNDAFFVGAYNAANAPVADSWSNGFTIAYGNNTDFKKQFCYAGEKWWTRGRSGTNWGTWRQIWDSGGFNPDNYLLLSGGTMTGDITFGSNGRSLKGSDGGNIAGVLYDTPNARYVTAIGTGSRRLILVSPASIYRGTGGVAENYMIYDSGNFNPDNYLLKTANAVSASKWATARTLTLTGSASGNVSMDGSANMSLSVTNNRLNSNSEMTYGWNGINYFNLAGIAGAAAKTNDTPTTTWWHILRFNHENSAGYYTDLAVPFNDNTLYYKRVTSGTLQNGGWVKIWDEKNANLSTVDWAAKNITAAGTVTATKLVIGGITIDVYNGALRVNGNLVVTGSVTAYQ